MKPISKSGIVAAIVLSVAFMSGCETAPAKAEKHGMSQAVKTAIAAANAANKKAKSVGYEWRDTHKIIKKAKKAGMKGHDATALKLAKKAETQAKLAVKQYNFEKTQDRSVK